MSDLSKCPWSNPFTPWGSGDSVAENPAGGLGRGCSAGQDGCSAMRVSVPGCICRGMLHVCTVRCAWGTAVAGVPWCHTASPWAPAEPAIGTEMPGEGTRGAIVSEAAVAWRLLQLSYLMSLRGTRFIVPLYVLLK